MTPRRRRPLNLASPPLWAGLLAACTLLTASACGERAPQTPAADLNAAASAEAAKPTRAPIYDDDGLPLESDVRVYDEPLPVMTYTASAGVNSAGYVSRHTYAELVAFYKKNLPDYTVKPGRGGTRFISPDGKHKIYVLKSGGFEGQPRVMYFNSSGDASAPPPVRDPRLDDPAYVARLKAAEERAKARDAALAERLAKPRKSGPAGGSNYTRRVASRDGKEVIILSPRDDAPGASSKSPGSRAALAAPSGGGARSSYTGPNARERLRAKHPGYGL